MTRILSLRLTAAQETPLTTTGLIPSIDQSKLVTARLLFSSAAARVAQSCPLRPTMAGDTTPQNGGAGEGCTHQQYQQLEKSCKINLPQSIICWCLLAHCSPLYSPSILGQICEIPIRIIQLNTSPYIISAAEMFDVGRHDAATLLSVLSNIN